MEVISVEFRGLPPFKASPGGSNTGAKERQSLFRAAAGRALDDWRRAQSASHVVFPWDPMDAKVSLSLTYARAKGENDAANIIGGVADALQGVTYADDKQVREITYKELQQGMDADDTLLVRIAAVDGVPG